MFCSLLSFILKYMDSYLTQVKIILQTIIYATVATASSDGAPWSSPVAHQLDEDLNVYWFSDKESQHSRNVRQNENVFIVIYDSTVPEGDGCGVYPQAKAYEANDPEEIRKARRIKKDSGMDAPDDFMGDAVRRVYKAVPTKAWMNADDIDNGKFIRDYRVELSLDQLKEMLREK